MQSAEVQEVTASFVRFSQVADSFIHVRTVGDYKRTLDLIEALISEADDSVEDPRNILIGILADAIEAFEENQEDILRFESMASDLDPAVSMLRLLMSQHGLNANALRDEIGSKSLVSMILSGKRSLTRDHIAKLSKRFSVSPALFFDQPDQPNRNPNI